MPDFTLPLSLTLALAANLLADRLLVTDLRRSSVQLTDRQRRVRILHWVVCAGGLAALGLLHLPMHTLIVLALFSVSAATDFETRLIPPDAYVFGCVLLSLLVSGLAGGFNALRDTVVAQAFCFAVVTLGVAFFNLCESGDIKLAMQFGAACGSLPMVAVGAAGIWLAAIVLVVLVCATGLFRKSPRQAIERALAVRPPQGPLMWCGLLATHAVVALWRAGAIA